MKLRVEVNGEPFALDLDAVGEASVQQISPGVFSVLVGSKSILVHIAPHPDGMEVWTGLTRHLVTLSDPRDKAAGSTKASTKGPVELRAQMPGKIIKLLEPTGANVKAGQGLIVVEAMKMQNEVKSPKDGTVGKINVAEGATVAAGELLMVVV